MSFELLAYNIAISMDGQEQSKKELVITKKIEKTIYALNKIQNIQNISVGLAGASGLYFLFGCGIPYAKYIKKKNPLEKDVI
jgi:hypothetical protein